MKSSIFFILFFFSIALQAQVDSTEVLTDTVYIQADPVVVKKYYYLSNSDSISINPWFVSMAAGLAINLDRTNTYAITKSYGPFSSISLMTGRQYKHLILGVGLSLLNSNVHLTVTEQHSYDKEKTETKPDTLDVYYQLVSGVLKKYYVIVPKDTTVRYTEIQEEQYKSSKSVTYFQIPLQIQYFLRIKSWFIAPGLSVIPGYALFKTTNEIDEKIIFKKPMFMAGMFFECGKQLSPHYQLALFTQGLKNFSAVANPKLDIQYNLFGGGIKLKYIF